jgi:hypothetical protein
MKRKDGEKRRGEERRGVRAYKIEVNLGERNVI